MSVYESIFTGLTEALEDSKSEHKTLKRNTVNIPESISVSQIYDFSYGSVSKPA